MFWLCRLCRHCFYHLIHYSLCCHVMWEGMRLHRIYSLTTSILLSKRMGKIARTFFSVTIKATELVLIKQDTWSRCEQHVNDPARLQTHLLYSHALFCSQYCSTVTDLSLDMYTSWKKACNKEIRQNKSWLNVWLLVFVMKKRPWLMKVLSCFQRCLSFNLLTGTMKSMSELLTWGLWCLNIYCSV